jgi:hypothetical protein
MSHGNAVSDIVLVFNQAQGGLYGIGSKDSTLLNLFSTINRVRDPFIKFCKAHKKHLHLFVQCKHVNFAHPHSPHEEDPTLVCISYWTRLLCSGMSICNQPIWHPTDEEGLDKPMNTQINM